jgi:hypothetical protein
MSTSFEGLPRTAALHRLKVKHGLISQSKELVNIHGYGNEPSTREAIDTAGVGNKIKGWGVAMANLR